MERILAPVFVVIVLCAGLSLDFYSQRRADPGLSLGGYAEKRLGPVLGGADDRGGDEQVTTAASGVPDGASGGPSALTTIALAADTLGMLSGAKGRGGDDGAAGAMPSPGAAFAQIAMAIAAGNRDAILPAAAMGAMADPGADATADPAIAPEEPVSLIQPVKPLTGSTCDTRAGTKFCSVGGG